MRLFSLCFIALCSLAMVACNQHECKSASIVFESSSPDTKAYKDELIRQISGHQNKPIRYWFHSYKTRGIDEYILIDVEGSCLKATMELLVRDWRELSDIRSTKGQGYRGAELKGLQYQVQQTDTNTDLIFVDLDAIID